MSFQTSGKIAQHVGVSAAGVVAAGTTINGAWISAADAPQIAVAVNADEDCAVQWQEATDSSGTGGQNLGSAVDFDDTFGTSEIDAGSLTAGFTHVRAVVTLDASGAGAAIYMLGNRRYAS